jgi:peptidoglycan LD-endopeptidase LytH
MKWISTFLSGVLVGAIGIFVYLGSIAPGPAPAATPLAAAMTPATPCVAMVPAAVSAPSATVTLAAKSAAAEAPTPVAPAPAAAAVPDKLLIPVAGIHASQLNDSFNDARGAEGRHEAIDILAPRGTQVLAVADGKVAKLFDSKAGGLTVYQFDSSEKLAFYYAHLDRYAAGIEEGAMLKQGDLIGYVGTTGNADPATPHLHFAIFELGPAKQWWKGTPINPYPLLGGTTRP